MSKILFLGKGSEKDPSFEPCFDRNQMKQMGIIVIDEVVESCHGCPDLMGQYSKDLQSLAKKGHRVVAVVEGGMYFALPSIQATQTSFPIISCPLDVVAYQAFIVPSGHAAIATVGIEEKRGKEYDSVQRRNAIDIAARILDFEGDSPFGSICSEQDFPALEKQLEVFGIRNSGEGKLYLTYRESPAIFTQPKNPIQIWANPKSNLSKAGLFPYISSSDEALMTTEPILQVHGLNNLAIYAAKILSLTNPEMMEKIEKIGPVKRAGYQARDLLAELKAQGVE